MSAKKHINNLDDALQVLDTAAQKSSREVQSMIKTDYKNLKRTLEEVTPEVKSAIQAVSDKASTAAKETVENIDQHAKENPWWYVGGAVVAGGALGYFLSQRD